jgi:hypothetical protein
MIRIKPGKFSEWNTLELFRSVEVQPCFAEVASIRMGLLVMHALLV